jgi:hypothetical protein
LLAAAVAACTQPEVVVEPPDPDPIRTPESPPEPDAAPADAEAEGRPVPPPPVARPEGLAAPAGGQVAARPASTRGFAALVGLTDLAIRTELGDPEGVSARPPATVWRYGFDGCDLELFLFPDVGGGAPKALTFETRETPLQPGAERDRRCAGEEIGDG